MAAPVWALCSPRASSSGSLPCATAAPTAAPTATPRPKVLVWGTATGVERVNPQYSTQQTDIGVFDSLYEFLLGRDPDGKIGPRLATEWKALHDTTWQFKLRPGVKWHNGDPFTAADVKFTIERLGDPAAKTRFPHNFQLVSRVDVVDDLTANFVTKAPDPPIPPPS